MKFYVIFEFYYVNVNINEALLVSDILSQSFYGLLEIIFYVSSVLLLDYYQYCSDNLIKPTKYSKTKTADYFHTNDSTQIKRPFGKSSQTLFVFFPKKIQYPIN